MSALHQAARSFLLMSYSKEQLRNLATCDTGMGEIGPDEATRQLELIAALESEAQSSDGGPAFPIPLLPGEGWNSDRHGNPNGMTLRDYFAGMALMGAMSNPATAALWGATAMAQACFCQSDAMLVARKGGDK
jgi:hypothetical protein